jgi:hypothetical protein
MRSGSGESSSLESVLTDLAELAAGDVVSWSDEQVRTAVPALLSAVNQLNAVVAGVVGSFDVRSLSEVDGCRTTRTWLTAFGRMSQGAASPPTRPARATAAPLRMAQDRGHPAGQIHSARPAYHHYPTCPG